MVGLSAVLCAGLSLASLPVLFGKDLVVGSACSDQYRSVVGGSVSRYCSVRTFLVVKSACIVLLGLSWWSGLPALFC